MPKQTSAQTRKETVRCGLCFKCYSYLDWSHPAKELEKHYLDGTCPKSVKV